MALTSEESWIRLHVAPAGPMEVARDRPWGRVLRVPVANGVVWFKACGAVQAFEPRLTAELYTRWPDRVSEVLAHDEERGWLLLADAGTSVRLLGNPPEAWLAALPEYAELQVGEAAHGADHLAHGVPDLRLGTLVARFDWFLRHDLPLEREEIRRLGAFAARFAEWCEELASFALPDTIQHDDLHLANLYRQGDRLRVLDWGDASISHPFASLVETFRFLESVNGLTPDDPWFARLRDAYLEPWGSGLLPAFELAIRVGTFAHLFAWARTRDGLPPEARDEFDAWFRVVLRRALALMPRGG